MNKIENLYDEFFNSKDIQQANVIINEVMKLQEKQKAQFYRFMISNFKGSQHYVTIMLSYLKELGQHEELKRRMFTLFHDNENRK